MADDNENTHESGEHEHATETVENGQVRKLTPYEIELRSEAAKKQRKIRELTKAHETALAERDAAADARIAAAIAEANAAATDRVKRALLTTEAIRAGMLDPSDLASIDTKAVDLGADGKLTVPGEFWEGVKKAKPHLFGKPPSLTGGASPPVDTTPKNARTMTREEAMAQGAALGIQANRIR